MHLISYEGRVQVLMALAFSPSAALGIVFSQWPIENPRRSRGSRRTRPAAPFRTRLLNPAASLLFGLAFFALGTRGESRRQEPERAHRSWGSLCCLLRVLHRPAGSAGGVGGQLGFLVSRPLGALFVQLRGLPHAARYEIACGRSHYRPNDPRPPPRRHARTARSEDAP